MESTRRRILVALEPAVLEGAMALLLGNEAGNEVVQFHDATGAELAGRYDAAIVTASVLEHVDAAVVITLPESRTGGDVAHVAAGPVNHHVALQSFQQVVDLLDEQFPGELRAVKLGDV